MSLKSLNLKPTYSTEESSLLHDFYIPALSCSTYYDRAVGYFSASMLSYAAQGLTGGISKRGKVRLLIGEKLSQEEYAALEHGIKLRQVEASIDEKLEAILNNADSVLLRKRLELLSWLVAANRLDIRFCLTDRGMYHEKMGVLTDDDNNQIVFQGSANETVAALSPDMNFESIVVFPSWKQDVFSEYGSSFIDRFELMWQGSSHHIRTIEIPSKSYDLLRSYYKSKSRPIFDEFHLVSPYAGTSDDGGFPSLPTSVAGQDYHLRDHQRAALQDWRTNDYRGILAHATGSGKTISALHGATVLAKFHKDQKRNFIVMVSVPYQVLADQWCDVWRLFNVRPHRCYGGYSLWQSGLRQDLSSVTIAHDPKFVAIVVVNATLHSERFQSFLERINMYDLLFIGDECHHHHSLSSVNRLPQARYRLGLSATPWAYKDLDSQTRLRSYYSGIVSTYTIKHALEDGVLVPYRYLPVPIELTQDEAGAYQRFSEKIAQLLAAKEAGSDIDEEYLGHLTRARNRVLGSAELKFEAFERRIAATNRQTHSLIYCGDGSTEKPGDETTLRDVERVATILHSHKWKSSRFTAEESQTTRLRILENFRYTYINAIVAIRVLDEGFDMPLCHTAYILASSRNERQFIQRRGRILRVAPGKDSANIHDYIVTFPSSSTSEVFRTLVSQELARAIEFARFSSNCDDVMPMLEQLAGEYNLDISHLQQLVADTDLRADNQ